MTQNLTVPIAEKWQIRSQIRINENKIAARSEEILMLGGMGTHY